MECELIHHREQVLLEVCRFSWKKFIKFAIFFNSNVTKLQMLVDELHLQFRDKIFECKGDIHNGEILVNQIVNTRCYIQEGNLRNMRGGFIYIDKGTDLLPVAVDRYFL